MWKEVKDYFQIFEEWYNDRFIFHLIGFAIAIAPQKEKISEEEKRIARLIGEYKSGSKSSFKSFLIDELVFPSLSIISLNHWYLNSKLFFFK